MDVRTRSFAEALESLSYLVHADLDGLRETLDPRLIDGLLNGQVQKFEYTLELGWEALKDFLKRQEGVDEASPKKVVKAFYLAGYLTEDDYLALLQAIDDRNKLSHIYEKREFDLIVARLSQYTRLLQGVLATITPAADQS